MLDFILAGNIVGCRIYSHVISDPDDFACDRVDFLDRLHFVSKQFDPHRILRSCRINIHRIAAHAKISPFHRHIVSGILNVHQFSQQFLPVFFHARPQRNHLILVVDRTSQSVDTRYAGNNDYIPAL